MFDAPRDGEANIDFLGALSCDDELDLLANSPPDVVVVEEEFGNNEDFY